MPIVVRIVWNTQTRSLEREQNTKPHRTQYKPAGFFKRVIQFFQLISLNLFWNTLFQFTQLSEMLQPINYTLYRT
jgi:hypothetical protein